ncbi:SDR family oxidoreductase [Aliiroseovarius sp. S1339]|uniref:SDR family oxidoreductase n=1 Tax=Aliiroseovarius sp. S1339 TaxID=2936990 RepID=UPI0020C11A64|nr:SDR family oxidoreductase [Aliiroseovarius sp. S1339]MCK8462668.1 SDR family oxidoreductase [Aliiroseovarius sp. S1339]
MHLDHITLHTRDLACTRAFFPKVFGDLEERDRPKAIHRDPGHRLYAGDKPFVHLIVTRGNGRDTADETFDHFGIRLAGYKSFRARLQDLGIQHSTMDFPEIEERLLFSRAPSSPLLEAVARILANELAPIRVNVISPHLTDTEAHSGMNEEARNAMLDRAVSLLPLVQQAHRKTSHESLFAIDNPFVTGAVMDIDGGALIN